MLFHEEVLVVLVPPLGAVPPIRSGDAPPALRQNRAAPSSIFTLLWSAPFFLLPGGGDYRCWRDCSGNTPRRERGILGRDRAVCVCVCLPLPLPVSPALLPFLDSWRSLVVTKKGCLSTSNVPPPPLLCSRSGTEGVSRSWSFDGSFPSSLFSLTFRGSDRAEITSRDSSPFSLSLTCTSSLTSG